MDYLTFGRLFFPPIQLVRVTAKTDFTRRPATTLNINKCVSWRRKWQPTSAFLPGESHGEKSLVGHHLVTKHCLNLVTKQKITA